MESVKNRAKNLLLVSVVSMGALFWGAGISYASSTSGTIDGTNRYAWSETGSWIDFGGSYGAVAITDSELSGYAFGENTGWISLNCSNGANTCATVDYKVSNDGNGALSGYAWSESAGWINFSPTNGGVSIDSSGNFSGYAWGENIGWIVFNCSTTNSCATVDYKVSTDWRPRSARPACNNSSDDDGDGKTDYPSDPGCTSADDADETDPALGNGAPGSSSFSFNAPTPRPQIIYPDGRVVYLDEQPASVSAVSETAKSIVESVSSAITSLVPSFLKKAPIVAEPTAPPKESTPKTAPLAMQGDWKLLPSKQVGGFVLAPLPNEIRALTKKFPELGKTFKKTGITKVTDLSKLRGVNFNLPGISEESGLSGGVSVPLASLSKSQKAQLPTEIVFAKAGDLIDYQIALSITEGGVPEQKINTIAGKALDLAVKPDQAVKSVKGYLTVKNLERETARRAVPVNSMMAAPIVAVLGSVGVDAKNAVPTEEKLVLSRFEYTDSDKDGIWTASISSPAVRGEYEVITVLEYKNTSFGSKALRLVTVVDPEGYVYEARGNRETRIPDAKVSLLWKDSSASGSSKFILWSAKEYQQINPQKTDKSGTYSYLVPEGLYKLTVTAKGYYDFESAEFSVLEGRGVHENIKLKPKSWWRTLFGAFK